MKRLFFAACLAIAGLSAAEARAWECTPTGRENGPTLVWLSRCIPYYLAGNGTLLNAHERAVVAALEGWTAPECSDLTLQYSGVANSPLGFRTTDPEGSKNVIAVSNNPQAIPDPALISFEVMAFNAETGEILDADLLLNDFTYDFDDLTSESDCSQVFDLESVLSFELGRTIGLQSGRTTDACKIDNRALSDDELDGLCTIYPAGLPNNTCVPAENYETVQGLHAAACVPEGLKEVSGCACNTSEQRNTNTSLFFAFAALFLITRRAARR